MEAKKKDNRYSVIVFFEDNIAPKKWTYVHKLNGFRLFLDKDHPSWSYINIYDRRSRAFLTRLSYRDHFPAFLDE